MNNAYGKKFTLSELMLYLKQENFLEREISPIEKELHGFSPISDPVPNTVSWIRNELPEDIKLASNVVLCPAHFNIPSLSDVIFVPVKEPKRAFAKSVINFSTYNNYKPVGIAHTSIIADNVKLGMGVYIGEYTVLEENVVIGSNTRIDNHVTIKSGTVIGNNCSIFSGTVIGNAGFGYVRAPDGSWEHFPHIGKVIIKDNVDIGSNTVIDKAALGKTIIGEGTKIDSHVYIAHNSKIGKNCIITANVTIAGSVTIGGGVWIGPSSSILDGCTIGDNAYIGMGTVVIISVGNEQTVAGVPGKVIRGPESANPIEDLSPPTG